MYCFRRYHHIEKDLCGNENTSYQFFSLANEVQGNAGDSRTVLGIKGRAKPLSFDHKPQNEGKFSAN